MKSYVFILVIEPDKFEDCRDAWHASCPALKGCHTWGHSMRKHSRTSVMPLTFTFSTFSKPGRQYRWIKPPSSWRSLPFLSMHDACPTRPVGSPIRFIRALEGDGFALQRVGGSHRIYRHADGRRVVMSYHALNDAFPIGTGTIREMITDARWQDGDTLRPGLMG
jgi:predicted RNA binding protein YcfA (HicA-like mRNA interferase family)